MNSKSGLGFLGAVRTTPNKEIRALFEGYGDR
jgi:hypothetical protein